MLKHAFLYKEQLQQKYAKAMTDEHFKYYIADSYVNYTLDIKEDDWDNIQRVSVDKNNDVIGYMSCYIERHTNICRNFGILNFTKKQSITFSKDVFEYLKHLKYNCGATKFEFLAIEGSPSEKIYNKFIKKHGGRVIGIQYDTIKLTDGKMYNAVLYEIMRDYMKFWERSSYEL